MRLISQDGLYNLPYDQTALLIKNMVEYKKYDIIAFCGLLPDFENPLHIARYKTLEEANDIMNAMYQISGTASSSFAWKFPPDSDGKTISDDARRYFR